MTHIAPAKKQDIHKATQDITFIIPCGGSSKSMKCKLPKSLLEVGNERVVDRQIRIIQDVYPLSEILLVTGYCHHKFLPLIGPRVRCIFNPIFNDTNTSFAMNLGLQACNTSRAMIVYGNLIFNKEALFLDNIDQPSSVFCSDLMSDEEIGVIISEGHVSNMSFGLPNKWSQILYLAGRELGLFRNAVADEKTWKWLGYESVNLAIDKGGVFKYYRPTEGKVVKISTLEDLKAKL